LTDNNWFFRVEIRKGSKLLKYEQQLSLIFKNRDAKQLNGYIRKLFQDCFAFVKKELKAENPALLGLEFVKNQAELDAVQKHVNTFAIQKEKPKYPPRALIVWNKANAKIVVNIGFFFELLKSKGYQSFIITLSDTYIHEVIHYFYPSKTHKETYDTQCELLESFLGIKLPTEAKKLQSSEFYY
jgi:hypothetical protein